MTEITTNLNLPIPLGNENVNRQYFVDLIQAIDTGAVSQEQLSKAIGDIKIDLVDAYDSTDKQKAVSADALRRGLETKQNTLRLADNYLNANVLINAPAVDNGGREYPSGVSMFKVSTSTAGWPTTNGYVLTFRVSGGGYQVFYESYAGTVQTEKNMRQWTRSKKESNNFWQPWTRALTELDQLDYVRQPGYAVTSGTGTSYTVALDPVPSSLPEGFGITIVPHVVNTGAATLKVGGNVVVALKNTDGADFAAGDLPPGLPVQFRKVGANFIKSSGGGMREYFGDGSDEDFNSTANTTLPSTLNGPIVVKNYKSFILNAGHTFTVSNPCRGLFIFVDGDVTINGTLTMIAKGGLNVSYPVIPETPDKYKTTYLSSVMKLYGGAGGNGGKAVYGGPGGTGGAGRLCVGGFGGGGGGGTAYDINTQNSYHPGGAGGSIQYQDVPNPSFTPGNMAAGGNAGINGSGGSGGGMTYRNSGTPGTVGQRGGGVYGGGGGGGGGGTDYNAGVGRDGQYAGGFICIIAKGSITVGSTGIISASGGTGGAGGGGSPSVYSDTWGSYGGGGGGGAGGGVISLFYKINYKNSGNLSVTGGSGGYGGSQTPGYYRPNTNPVVSDPGFSGSPGTVLIKNI
ncbi:hypothetical protein [Saccharibacillus sp. JS10]|uniref:hypothetical protein n=1 Tax=Saccharibacillus sp. JS10 TaxID=2950552 RepID=UPI00210BE328|nr:hypothetical protein [Saccharibacillus sp. JS10]